jgi:hypothetical protein
MANAKSNIYPIQLQGAELCLNRYDAEIKQYRGFNKKNSPFVGGCLSNVFTKEEQISGGNADNTYIDTNGDVYRVTEEGLFKNDEKVLDVDSSKLYDIETLDIKYNVVELFDEYAFIYADLNENNTFSYYLRYFDFNNNEWHTELLIDYDQYSAIAFSLKRIKQDNTYLWVIGCQRENKTDTTKTISFFKVFASVLDGENVRYGTYTSADISEVQHIWRKGNVLCTVHAVYNATLDKFYVALFLSNAIGDTNNYFAHIYSVALTVSDTVSFTVNNDKNMKGVNDLDTQYCSFQDNIAKTNFQQSGSTAYYCFWYFVTNSRIWLENYDRRTDGRTIQNCDIGLIPDDELGFKIQFSNPLYAPSILSYDFNISFRTYKLHNFGCLISTRATNTSNACGYCDYITYAVTFREGAAHFDTGAVLNKVILMNNEVVTGLTLPDTQRILVTDWNSVDEENIYLTNYSSRDSYDFKDDSVVIYKANNKFYKLVRTDKPKLRLVNNQIVINCDMLKNSYRITDGAKLLFAPSWNNRVLIDTATTRNTDLNVNTYYVATSINEYKLDNNASIILNPIPVINPINITVNRRNLNEELPELINMFGGDTAEIKYKGSSFNEDFSSVYNVNTLDGLPFPIDANGNVQLCPSLFADVKNSYGNNMLIKDGNTYYPLMIGNNNEIVMSFYLASGIENLEELFIIQGQFYGIINKQLFSMSYQNGVVAGVTFVVDISGLQFVGNTPYEALFFSKTNRCLYSFTGANVLNQKQLVDKISEVRNYLYNPATQTVFLITDIGVLFYGLFGMFLLEYTDISNIFLLDNGIVMSDNSGNYRYIKYYLDEGDTDYTKENINVETSFYGMNNEVVTINDCLYFRIFSEEHEEGDLKVSATTISLSGRKTEETTFKIKASDWDKITHTIYLRYQPKTQRGLGVAFAIDSPFKIASLSVGSQPDAVLVDKVSKGAITAPSVTTNNNEW